MNFCPCHSGNNYSQCCEPFHLQTISAPTPETLMRSRYSAYVIGAIEYIYETYASSCRANQSLESIKAWADSVSFIKLEIIDAPNLSTTDNSLNATNNDTIEGYVEFIASYIDSDELCKLHERSRFIQKNQQWYYVDGKITPHKSVSIGRNSSCPCSSGKKFKRCHQ